MAQGMLSSFSDTISTQRTVSNIIKLIDPQDTPCLSYFGTDAHKRIRMENFPNHKVEWLEDTLRVRSDQLAEALDNSETGVDIDDGTKFKPGDVILCEDEKMYISSIATNTLTVIRGWGDSSAVTHADDTAITYLYSAREEGDDSDAQPYTVPTSPYNHSQIFHHEIKISGSEMNATSRYGIPDRYKYELMKALGGLGGGNGKKGNAGDLMIDLERTFAYGERVARSSGVAGGMGGFETYVTTNVTDLSGSSLDPKTFEDAVEDAWSYGGKPNVIVTNAFGHRKLTSFYAGSVRTERSELTGGVVITKVVTHFGELDILLNRWVPNDNLYICQRDLIGWCTLRDWKEEPLAKTGDFVRGQVVGEFSFVVANQKAHALIKNMSTTS